jgi:ankyrin repeat protein
MKPVSICGLKSRWMFITLGIATGLSWSAPSANELFDALKDGKAAHVRRVVEAGAPLNATDAYGSSPLMYAVLYLDVELVRLLLEGGADPNHANEAGATALMWAIPDEAKVRLLLKKGARVNAISKITGRTSLLIAAGRPGAARVVRLLLEKGADPKARDNKGETTLTRAAYSGDPEILGLLIDRGVDVNAQAEPFKDFHVTALMIAAFQGHTRLMEMLIAHGADTKIRNSLGFTALNVAASYRDFTPFKLLIAKGADPSQRHIGGDLLMGAAASDTATPELIGEIVKLGLDPKVGVANLHVQHGYGKDPERPLDWASRHGATPVTMLLSKLTGDQPRPESPDETPRLKAATSRAAIEKALPLLYDGGSEFFKRTGCTSCHHNMLQAVAFSHARKRGIIVDDARVRHNYQQSLAWVKGSQEGLFEDIAFGGENTNSGYLLWQFEADRHTRDRATDAIVHQLAASQAIDGSWHVSADRPPMESGRVTPTAISTRGLRTYQIPGRKAEFDARIKRAVQWLAQYRARTGEERAMRLLGLTWGGAKSELIQGAAFQLAAAQRADGGWAQLDTLSSDAYATGQALYALNTAGHLPDETLQKAVRFLLDSQLADGSWHVRSRSYPIQPNYFDTGFPHGRDQWISAAGTSWACIGLSFAVKP